MQVGMYFKVKVETLYTIFQLKYSRAAQSPNLWYVESESEKIDPGVTINRMNTPLKVLPKRLVGSFKRCSVRN